MTTIEACDKDVAARRKDLLLKYRVELAVLKTRVQEEGDLDGLLATDKEYKRALTLDALNEQDLVTKPEILRELQRKYIGQLANVERATATEHIERLKETKRQLTVAGKIADAVGTQKDIEKLEAKYLGGGGTSGVGDTGGSTDDVVEQCERAIRERTAKMYAEYEQQLAHLAANYQKRGELEKLLVVKSEQERFGRVKQIALRDLVEAPDELAQLQAKYQQGPEVVKLAVATEWLSKLQEQKKRLTMENKLDKAVEVQKQMDTIIRKYDITAEKLARVQAALGASRISTELSRTPQNYVEFGKTSCAILKTPRDLLNKTEITYEAWIFPDNEIQEGLVMFDGNEVAGHDNWLSYKAGKIVAVNNFEPNVQIESKVRAPARQWTHVALVLEQKRMAIFVNGSLDSEIRTTIGQHENTSAVFLGRNIYFGKLAGEQFLGRVADFRIWGRALSRQEIELASTRRLSNDSGLIAEWGFADGSFAPTKGKLFNSTSVGEVRIVNLEKTTTSTANVVTPSVPQLSGMDLRNRLRGTKWTWGSNEVIAFDGAGRARNERHGWEAVIESALGNQITLRLAELGRAQASVGVRAVLRFSADLRTFEGTNFGGNGRISGERVE
jgi:hypothetical protein